MEQRHSALFSVNTSLPRVRPLNLLVDNEAQAPWVRAPGAGPNGIMVLGRGKSDWSASMATGEIRAVASPRAVGGTAPFFLTCLGPGFTR